MLYARRFDIKQKSSRHHSPTCVSVNVFLQIAPDSFAAPLRRNKSCCLLQHVTDIFVAPCRDLYFQLVIVLYSFNAYPSTFVTHFRHNHLCDRGPDDQDDGADDDEGDDDTDVDDEDDAEIDHDGNDFF